jgi:radical SAM family uncharacterized protein
MNTDHNNNRIRESIERNLLPDVALPAQYIGGELGSIVKSATTAAGQKRNTFALVFPDLYEIGMSNYGFQLLYSLMNRRDDWRCERVFAPANDFETMLRNTNLPLYAVESFTPLAEFDLVGFSLQYELCYTNVLSILELGKIPLRSTDRTNEHPLIIAGGPCAAQPEPMSAFIDLFLIGDGEELLPRVADAWIEAKASEDDRRSAILKVARLFAGQMLQSTAQTGVYAPAFYDVRYTSAGRALKPRPVIDGLPDVIRPAIVSDIDNYTPDALRIVPLVGTVQDRIAVEIMRGCPGTCKFCQSNTLKRPVRKRSIESIVTQAEEACRATGITEVSLLSLSTSDYPRFEKLMETLHEKLEPMNVAVSVPSLRVNHQLASVTQLLTTERSSGLTLAPEAALDTMRQRIGKGQVTNENLLAGCQSAFESGFNRIKMYFMVGLPEETDADIDGILQIAYDITSLSKRVTGRVQPVTANVSNFVPKPHTPFERQPMQTGGYFQDAHFKLKRNCKVKSVSVKYHGTKASLLEGLLSRGDRRLSNVIETAYNNGARLDAWNENFNPELWDNAIKKHEIPVDEIVHKKYEDNEELAWEHVRW